MVTRVRSGEPERSSEKSEEVVRDEVKEYYGKILAKTEDLKTNACCTAEAPPPHVRDALAKVHPDVLAKYYGCGLVAPVRDCAPSGSVVVERSLASAAHDLGRSIVHQDKEF